MGNDPREQLINTPLNPTGDKVTTHGFLMAIEAEPHTDLNRIVWDVMQSCVKNASIRDMDVEHLGEIETYDEDAPDMMQPALPSAAPEHDPKLKGN